MQAWLMFFIKRNKNPLKTFRKFVLHPGGALRFQPQPPSAFSELFPAALGSAGKGSSRPPVRNPKEVVLEGATLLCRFSPWAAHRTEQGSPLQSDWFMWPLGTCRDIPRESLSEHKGCLSREHPTKDPITLLSKACPITLTIFPTCCSPSGLWRPN